MVLSRPNFVPLFPAMVVQKFVGNGIKRMWQTTIYLGGQFDNHLNMISDIDTRIAELQAAIAPLAEELQRLKRQKRARLANLRSAEFRQKKKQDRDDRIKKALRAQRDDLYKRNTGGLIKRLALEFGVSERKIGSLFAELKKELY